MLLCRVFVSAVLFSVAPVSATLLVLSVYVVNAVTYGLTLPGGWCVAAVAAYASLFSPAGHAKNHGHHSSVIQKQQQQYRSGSLLRRKSQADGKTRAAVTLHESYSEVERAKINQESLVVRVRLSHALFLVTSLLAMVPYVALLEVFLFSSDDDDKSIRFKRNADGSDLVPALKSRAVLYSVPAALLILLIPVVWLFCRRVVMARDAARQWFAITPHRNRNPSTPARGGSSSERQASYTQRLRAEEEAVSFHRDGSSAASEASTARVTDHRPIVRPSAPPPSIPESLPPPYEPHYSEPKHLYPEMPQEDHVPTTPVRRPPGTSKCSGSCVTCELFVEGSSFRSEMTGRCYRFVPPVNCRTASVVYLVSCNRCRKQYVGKTEQTLRQRHYGHRREIETAASPLGRHFAEECGYANWRMQVFATQHNFNVKCD